MCLPTSLPKAAANAACLLFLTSYPTDSEGFQDLNMLYMIPQLITFFTISKKRAESNRWGDRSFKKNMTWRVLRVRCSKGAYNSLHVLVCFSNKLTFSRRRFCSLKWQQLQWIILLSSKSCGRRDHVRVFCSVLETEFEISSWHWTESSHRPRNVLPAVLAYWMVYITF